MFANQIFKSASTRLVCGKQSMRGAMKVMTNQSGVMGMTALRLFTSNAQVEKAVQKLNKALDKEIKYENENYSQLEDIDTFLKESGFEYSEQEDGIIMTLTKTVGDKKVEI